MSDTTTYSFDDVTCTMVHPLVGLHTVTGTGVGSIGVTMNTTKTVHDIAADGSVMISKIPGNNGTIAIEVQQTSSFHKWLLGYYNAVVAAPSAMWAQASIVIQDKVGGITITALSVSPEKRADRSYQAEGQRVTWNLMAANIQELPLA